MLDTVLALKDVRLTLAGNAGPVDILKGISLEVHAGETVGLVGPSGSGKTTFLNLAALRIERVDREGALKLLEKEVESDLGKPGAEHYEQLFKDFGYLPPSADLRRQYLEAAEMLVAGFYQPTTKRLYLIKN